MGIIFKNKQNFACMFDGVVWIKTNDGQTTLTIVQNEKKNPKSNDFKNRQSFFLMNERYFWTNFLINYRFFTEWKTKFILNDWKKKLTKWIINKRLMKWKKRTYLYIQVLKEIYSYKLHYLQSVCCSSSLCSWNIYHI